MKPSVYGIFAAAAFAACATTGMQAGAQNGPPSDLCRDNKNTLLVWFRDGGYTKRCTGLSRSNSWTWGRDMKRVRLSLDVFEAGGCTWYFKDGGNWKKISSVGAGQNSNYTFDDRPPHHRQLKVNC